MSKFDYNQYNSIIKNNEFYISTSIIKYGTLLLLLGLGYKQYQRYMLNKNNESEEEHEKNQMDLIMRSKRFISGNYDEERNREREEKLKKKPYDIQDDNISIEHEEIQDLSNYNNGIKNRIGFYNEKDRYLLYYNFRKYGK